MLLLRLHRLALRLQAWRPVCIVLALAGIGLIGHELLVDRPQAPAYLNLAIVLTLWGLMLFAFIQLFQRIPAPVLPKDSFVERLRSRCKLACYHLLALAVTLTGAMLVSISVKLVAAG